MLGIQDRNATVGARRVSAQQRLGIAIVGCGGRGAENASAVPRARHVRLAAVMDTSEALAQRVGDQFDAPWTTSYDSVLADDSVDIVFINTPHHLHAEQAIRAARAGKHVIVEKPLALSLQDAVQMAKVAAECGVCLSTWLGYRYTPAVVKARRLVEAGLLGDLLGAHLAFFNNKPASYFAGSGSGSNWRSRWDTCGGGILLMTGIHYLDWLLYLTGMKVAEVSARYATLHSPAEVEDSIVMWLTFTNGALASMNMSSCVQGGNTTNVDLRVWGTDGHLSLTPPFQFYPTRLIDGRLPERWSSLEPLPKLRFGDERMHISVEYLEYFARAILNDQPPDIPVDAGLELQAIIEAAYQSSREGRPVAVQYPEWRHG